MLKKIFVIVIAIVILLPIIFTVVITLTNDSIARDIKNRLKAYQLPEDTEFVEAFSNAAKITGSGNGMQYVGALVVKSDLTENELNEYYSEGFDYLSVEVQGSNVVDFEGLCHYLKTDCDYQSGNYYLIISFDDNRREKYSDFFVDLLDLDLRGH